MAALLAVVLAACGGGGASSSTASGGTETPSTETPTTETPATGSSSDTTQAPDLTLGDDSFYFAADATYAQAGALDAIGGGSGLFTAWNPNDTSAVLKPGMKVMFFGAASGCDGGVQGPLANFDDTRLAALSALTGMSAGSTGQTYRWTPSGNTAGCSNETKAQSGGSSVFLNTSDAAGGVGMITTSGPNSAGETYFLGPYTASGQDGSGTNAYITGSFVNFRQTWWGSNTLQPWVGTAAARLRSVQSVGSTTLDTVSGAINQVKQQIVATFLNPTCRNEASAKPCQIQYLLNTAIYRANVSDWSKVSWFQKGDVWFDAAQGGIPVVDGPIYASGTSTMESTTGGGLFTSQGAATQHASFSKLSFDVTISFDQLATALRVATAKALNIAAADVTDAQMVAQWGSAWNDRTAWILLTADVGQEVYNPTSSTRTVEIAGGFSSLFAGPQP